MKINDWPTLATTEKQERSNLDSYLDNLALWTYKYINDWKNNSMLTRITANYDWKNATLKQENISPEEIGVLALACRYYRPNYPINDANKQKEFAEYQYAIQSYIGITDSKLVTSFYADLIATIKPEHNKLIPILYTHHAQIHALKIAYDSLKSNIWKANIATRVIFWLICIEFMKLHVRLYLVEPLARTTEWSHLDWIYMLDQLFEDFTNSSEHNRDSFRSKNVVNINQYSELWFQGVMRHIKTIRDEVDLLKREKLWIPNEWKPKDPIPPINPTGYIRTIEEIRWVIKKQIP